MEHLEGVPRGNSQDSSRKEREMEKCRLFHGKECELQNDTDETHGEMDEGRRNKEGVIGFSVQHF